MQVYDIVFIGSGLSNSATLYNILCNLQKHDSPGKSKNIAVVEKHDEFFKGIAYGNRSSVHSLTINPVKDFLQANEPPLFFNWLNNFEKNNWPGCSDDEKTVLNDWTPKNPGRTGDIDLDGLYIPRFLYGKYIAKKLEDVITSCKAGNLANVNLICGAAIDITQSADDDSYVVDIQATDGLSSIKTTTLVLGTGGLATAQVSGGSLNKYLCIDDIYSPSLEINLKKLDDMFSVLPPEQRNILVIGSNASASEIVYILNKLYELPNEGFNKLSILSTSGLPDRLYVNLDYGYLLENLKELEQAGNYTADTLMRAIEKDVRNAAEQHNLSIGKIHYSLSDKVVEMQQKLNADEALKFFNTHGWSFTRITRRTSEDYYFTEKKLVCAGRLDFIDGRFIKLCDQQRSNEGLSFIYKKKGEDTEQQHEKVFPIIINCSGAEHLSNTSSMLYKNLINKGLCKINSNNMGLAVDENFLANNNFYVIGPLLAGIYNSKFKFWHLENAKRLNTLAAILSDNITSKWHN
jgi:uncharacterized NAD(P)/FAD-binding protein YdhS